MAFTVTATESGSSANKGVYLLVRVLTNATESGGATSGGASAVAATAASGSLTPNFSNSWVGFSISADAVTGGMAAALANNTYDSNNSDGVDFWSNAQGHYTGTVTASSALTYGTSSGTGDDHANWCAYEVPAVGGTIAVDGSSPALASDTANPSATTAAFSPPAGSVLVALIAAGGTGAGTGITVTMTDTSGLGLTWTRRAISSTSDNFQPTFIFTATVPFPPQPPAIGRARPGRTWARRFRSQQPPWVVPLAPVLINGNPPGGRVVYRRPGRSLWGGVLAQPGVPLTAVNGTVPPHLVVARRAAARAVARWVPVATANAAAATAVNGTVPAHLVVARRAAARAVWRGQAAPPQQGRAVTGGLVRRRQPARAMWAGVTARTTNLLNGNAPGAGLVRRRTAARALWAGTVARTTNAAAAQPVNGTVPAHLVVARRAAARAVWHATSTRTTNLLNGNPPGGAVESRRDIRPVWGGVLAPFPAITGQPGTAPAHLVVARRAAARAVARGTITRTVNAAAAPAVNGTVPAHLVVARRLAARVVWRGTVSRTVNGAAPVPVTQDHLVIARRAAARAVWRGQAVPGAARPPATGGLVRRRRPARARWRGYVSSTTNAPPPPFLVARSTPTVTAADTSAASVTDPRDGTPSVTARATSTPGVS